VIGLIAVAVVLVVLVVLAVRGLGGVLGGLPGVPGGDPSADVCPKPEASSTPTPQPNDGRVHSGPLSYPELPSPWGSPQPENDVPFGRDVLQQFVQTEKTSTLTWGAAVMVGELVAGDGFFEPKDGAEIVLIPSATPDKSLSRKEWEKELCAHAIFNEYFVAGLNRTGQEGNYMYYGRSVAFDPAGEMIAQAGPDEEVLMIECDLDLITQRRRAWQFYRDRRPDTYGILTALVP
jgi:hypothetical protein